MNSNVSPQYTTLDSRLTLEGDVGYRLHDNNNRVVINLQTIRSSRLPDTISGTLSVQLRALPQGYDLVNNQEDGWILASTTIGELVGEHSLIDCQYDLLFQAPPAGLWRLVVQLREWNGSHYTLCDSIEFLHAYCLEENGVEQESLEENSVEDKSVEKKSPEEKSDSNEIGSNKDNRHALDETIQENSPTQNAAQIDDTGMEVAPTSNTPLQDYQRINQAKAAQLTAVKGISKALCKSIIEERPFPSLAAILKVKGMGPKLLKRILDTLKD